VFLIFNLGAWSFIWGGLSTPKSPLPMATGLYIAYTEELR